MAGYDKNVLPLHSWGISEGGQAGGGASTCLQSQQGLVQQVTALQEGQARIGQVPVSLLADLLLLG